MTNEQQPTQPAQPDPRPQPQYGEMAPEGWTWTPNEAAGPQGAGAPNASAQGGGSPQFPVAQSAPQPHGQTPGVPHNLGVGAPQGASPQQPGQPYQPAQPYQQQQNQQAYRADPPPHYQQPAWQQQAPERDTKGADRVITIILLVIGAVGALYFAFVLFVMTQSIYLIANMVDLEVTVPESVKTLGLIGALIMLALYAVTLIFSIQRMRARKLAFWVPLVAGVLSFVVLTVFTSLAMAEVPDLLHYLSDPDNLSRLLGNLT